MNFFCSCWSPVGRQYQLKGPQELSIGDGCNYKQLIIHEFMHALGFWHEQSRTDRNHYIDVLWENIDPSKQTNRQAKTCSAKCMGKMRTR